MTGYPCNKKKDECACSSDIYRMRMIGIFMIVWDIMIVSPIEEVLFNCESRHLIKTILKVESYIKLS